MRDGQECAQVARRTPAAWGFDLSCSAGYTPPMLTAPATNLLAHFNRVTPADGDELTELSRGRGRDEAIRYFAERGTLESGSNPWD